MAILTREAIQQATGQSLPTSKLFGIPEGAAGVRATLRLMRDWTRKFRTDLTIRTLAERIVSHIPGRAWIAEAQAVQDWVRDHIRYTMDVENVETLKTPLALIANPYGDCDDMALLAGTLLNSLGHPVRYVAVGTVEPGIFDHVYVETRVADRWYGVETTENVHLGWTPENLTARMVETV